MESYDAATQTAQIAPLVKHVTRDNFEEAREVNDLPPLPGVPVCWPQGGGYFMTFPLAVGDTGLLVFCDSDIGPWRESAGVADPGDEGTHGLTGAVFIPGVNAKAGALSDASASALVLGKTGSTQIHIDASGVRIGAVTAAHPLVLGDTLLTWLSSHTHAVATTGTAAAQTGTAAPSALATTGITSTKHKVDA